MSASPGDCPTLVRTQNGPRRICRRGPFTVPMGDRWEIDLTHQSYHELTKAN